MYIYFVFDNVLYLRILYKANVCVNLSLNILHYYCKDVTCIKHKRCSLFRVVVHILHFRLKKKTKTNPIKTVIVTRTAPIEIRIMRALNTIDTTATFIVVYRIRVF